MIDGYCSAKCFKNSEEYRVYSTKMQKFYNSLTEEQQVELWSLWDNGIFTDGKFEVMVDKIIADPRRGRVITTDRMHKFTEVKPGTRVTKVLLYFGSSGHWKIEKIKPESDDSFYKDYFIEGMGKQVPTHWEELA